MSPKPCLTKMEEPLPSYQQTALQINRQIVLGHGIYHMHMQSTDGSRSSHCTTSALNQHVYWGGSIVLPGGMDLGSHSYNLASPTTSPEEDRKAVLTKLSSHTCKRDSVGTLA